MLPKAWAFALSVAVLPALAPDDAFAMTAGQCKVFGERDLLSDATRQACCREFGEACPEGAEGGFGGGSSQSQGFGGGTAGGAADAGGTGSADSVVDAINTLNSFAGGSDPSAGSSASPGWSGERNADSRTPEQDYAVKTTPYFFEDRSKYQK